MSKITIALGRPTGGGSARATGIGTGLVLCILFIALCTGMQRDPHSVTLARLFGGLDVFATLAFALVGTHTAGKYLRISAAPVPNYNSIVLALIGGIMTGIGGGLIRDIVVLRVMPAAITDTTMLPAAILGAIIGLQIVYAPRQIIEIAADTMDSIAIGVAIVVGTVKGQNVASMGDVAALNCGAIVCASLTACGGGIMRDLMLRRRPTVLSGFALLWPPLGALLHVVIFEFARSIYVTITPVDLWFITIPVFTIIITYFSTRSIEVAPGNGTS